jgi:hypothetical protein
MFRFCSRFSNMSRKILILPLAVASGSCEQGEARDWRGWVYPNGAVLSDDLILGAFPTLEQCRAAAKGVIARLPAADENGDEITADYECGFKCESDLSLGGLNVCEKTAK